MTLAISHSPPLLAFFSLENGLLVLGLLLIVASLMFMIRRKRSTMAARPTVDEQIEQRRQAHGLRGDLESIMVEIEQLAKRMGAQLDAKVVHLEMLLREADDRIDKLRRLQGNHESIKPASPPSQPEPAKPTQPTTRPDPSPQDPVAAKVYNLADEGLAPPDIARKLNEHVGKIELILALRQGA